MTPLVGYLLLFVVVAAGFIFVHLVAGKLIRPDKPGVEKSAIYECGEPTIGTAWIQFDLRFYVVALLFVIFDVEVAFLFPWAEVFGRANAVVAVETPPTGAELKDYGRTVADLLPETAENAVMRQRYQDLSELGSAEFEENRQAARALALLAFGEMAAFFGVLLVGFAYLWQRGDLAWVRSFTDRTPGTSVALPTVETAPAAADFAETGAA
jgi:NADH-quinone oxidoreductase subunit A